MSDFDSLREDIGGLGHAMNLYADSVNRHTRLTDEQIARLWTDNAELRDELHALANRLEALTNFVVSDPAEVAAKMVANEKRCPTCDGFGKVVKTAENATEPGPIGMPQKCATCAGTGAIYA